MSDQRTEHPTEERLVAWIDEPETAPDGAALEAHVAACAECRRRAEGIRALLAALATAPPSPGAAAFAAQRERILAALPERAGGRAVTAALVGWRPWWIPALAAAALAGLLLAGPGSREEAGNGDPAVIEEAPLPVQAAAQAAADEVFELAGAPDPAVPADPAAGTLAGLDEAAPWIEGEAAAFAELAVEFTELPADDQSAILEELSTLTFDL